MEFRPRERSGVGREDTSAYLRQNAFPPCKMHAFPEESVAPVPGVIEDMKSGKNAPEDQNQKENSGPAAEMFSGSGISRIHEAPSFR